MIDVDGLRPGDSLTRLESGHSLLVVRLRPSEQLTSKPLYLIVCQSCSRLVHEATTGPAYAIETHVGVARSA